MKRSNYVFESVLIVITAALGLIAVFSFDATILGALWLIALGVLQVVHSLIIGVNYWSNEAIQKSIIIYWSGIVLNFMVMLIGNKTYWLHDTGLITILIFPLMLALYLWYITYAYRIKAVIDEKI